MRMRPTTFPSPTRRTTSLLFRTPSPPTSNRSPTTTITFLSLSLIGSPLTLRTSPPQTPSLMLWMRGTVLTSPAIQIRLKQPLSSSWRWMGLPRMFRTGKPTFAPPTLLDATPDLNVEDPPAPAPVARGSAPVFRDDTCRQIPFTRHFSHAVCTFHYMHITLHGSRRATQRVCMRASFHLHAIPRCVFDRPFVVCLFVFSFSCFSPSFTSSLPHSACTLPSTSSPMSTASREITAAPSHKEEYCPMAIYHPPTIPKVLPEVPQAPVTPDHLLEAWSSLLCAKRSDALFPVTVTRPRVVPDPSPGSLHDLSPTIPCFPALGTAGFRMQLPGPPLPLLRPALLPSGNPHNPTTRLPSSRAAPGSGLPGATPTQRPSACFRHSPFRILSPDPQVPADTSLGTRSSHPRGGYIPPRCHILSVVARYEASLTSQSPLPLATFAGCSLPRTLPSHSPMVTSPPGAPGFPHPLGPRLALPPGNRPTPVAARPAPPLPDPDLLVRCGRSPLLPHPAVPPGLLGTFCPLAPSPRLSHPGPDPILPTIPAYVSSATHFSPSAPLWQAFRNRPQDPYPNPPS